MRRAGLAVVWQAEYDPFGRATVTSADPVLNLRLPGQYFDAETGLYYNMARHYDPGIGRYLQSDPIGLEGGINTYTYANNNPLIYVDNLGLNASGGAILIGIGTAAIKACMRISTCRQAVEKAIAACKNVECRFERHKRHHSFPGQGNMFCEHYSIRCYIKGVKGPGGLIFEDQWPFPGKCTRIKENTWLP